MFKILKGNIIFKNFFSLGVLQAVNLLIPLIITPYLLKTLGLTNFGKVTFAASVMAFFVMLSDYGFNLYLTKEVAVYREDPKQINKIFSISIITRSVLVCISFLLLLCCLMIPKFADDKMLFISSFCIVLGQSFVPTWIFQGMENLRPLAIINGGIKISYIAVVFFLIQQPNDYISVNILWGLNGMLCAFASIYYLIKKYNINFSGCNSHDVISYIKNGFSFFIAGFSVNIYTFCSSAILGLFASYESVALFGVAEKIIQIIRQPLPLFSQVIYPAGCRKAIEGKADFFSFLKKTYLPFLILFAVFAVLSFMASPLISSYFQAEHAEEVSDLVRIMLPAVFFIALNIPAYQALLSFGYNTAVSIVLSACSVCGIILNVILSSTFNRSGTAIHFIITEFIIMICLHIAVNRKMRESILKGFFKK